MASLGVIVTLTIAIVALIVGDVANLSIGVRL